ASWVDHIHPEDRPSVLGRTRAFVHDPNSKDTALVSDYRFRHGGDGREMWLQFTMRAVRNADGSVREVIGQNLDITAQKRMELELAEANERVNQVLANSPILSYSCVPVDRPGDPW
ncbi:MAG TPA: PAS domain-containing protein, partial [Anaerolineales bacterium]|nr:PAS domain-containing protein [Anaerolineales bacterium]